MTMVPLLPSEAAGMLMARAAALDPADLPLMHLVADGVSVALISHRLDVSERWVYRKLALIRGRLGVGSTAELGVLLASRGFGGGSIDGSSR